LAHNKLVALLCDKLGQYDKAVECFRKVIRRDRPEMTPAAYYNLGITPWPSRRSWTRPSPAYRKAVEIDPK
jgi:tetratricopeptide (TPR) repeat protein